MIDYSLAERINRHINETVTGKSDLEQYGVAEYWEIAKPGGFEDCDGYALAKRDLLLKAGASVADMFLAVCYLPSGEGHLVLAVNTDKGWFILDNLQPFPVEPHRLPYKWVSALRGSKWLELSWQS